MTSPALPDPEVAYRAVASRDPRFDGRLFVGVLSTGIYCRPSCPSRTPKPAHCAYYPSAAACVAAGFRACRRCRPDALPGSPDWDVDADLAGRALRLVADGAADDDDGVSGLARRLSVSPRHLHRVLVAQVGASPQQLALTRRAQVARMLVEQTGWPMADVAFAAGFRSVRQFNDVMRAHLGAPPSTLRRSGRPPVAAEGPLTLQLRHRAPFDADAWLAHVTARAIPGVEAAVGARVRRVVPGRAGPALVDVEATGTGVVARLDLPALDDLTRVVGRLRHWLDLDADPGRVAAALATDPLLAPLVGHRPGLRVAGAADPAETVLRTVLGQQVSVPAARTLAGRLVERLGAPVGWGLHRFPTPAEVAAAGPDVLRAIGLTGARSATLHAVATLLADGLEVGPGADRELVRAELGRVAGVGPWTLDYVALRALGDPDAFPSGDLVLRRAMGVETPAEALRRAEAWRPWRAYAAQHLWTHAAAGRPSAGPRTGPTTASTDQEDR